MYYRLYDVYKNPFLNDTIRRLNTKGVTLNRNEKINYIHGAYEDKELLSYLLYDYEIEFLKKNLNKHNIEINYITYQLEKLLILIEEDDCLRVNDYIKEDIIKGLEYYETIKVEADNTKYLVYFAIGVIRYKGIVSKEELTKAFLKQFHLNQQQAEDVANLLDVHPLFNRFVRHKIINLVEYFFLFEFKENDFEIINYESKECDYPTDKMINIGKYYLDTEGANYLIAINKLNNAIYLSKCDRAELIYLSGFAAYHEYASIHLLDENTKDIINLDYQKDIIEYLELLPSYYPCGKNSIFIDSNTIREMHKAYEASMYIEFRKEVFGNFPFPNSEKEENLIALAEAHQDEIDKINEHEAKDYYVYKFLPDKVVLLDIELKKLVYMKSNIYSFVLDTTAIGKVVNQNLVEVNGFLTPIVTNGIETYESEFKDEYDSICEKLMKD